MKIVLVLALVAYASAMPSPVAEPDPQLLLTNPLVYTYPAVKTVDAKTPAATVPIVYNYPSLTYPTTYNYPLGVRYTYSSGFPLTYTHGFPYNFPYVVTAQKAEEAAVEEA